MASEISAQSTNVNPMLRIASHHVNDCSRNRASIIVQKLGSMAYVMPPPRPDESAARAGSDQLKWRSVPPLEVKFHGALKYE